MTILLLIDLDDTLITNSMDSFLPAYFGGISKALDHIAPAEKVVADLMAGTNQMKQNQSPTATLESVFDAHFFPALGTEKKELSKSIDDFYQTIYPKLKQVTKKRIAAIQLVEEAKNRGFQMAIATNPLFPKTATYQRVEWAGLDSGDFEIITTFENFHFSKPNPAYYAELIALLGWPDVPIVMVGNDPILDIKGANQLGIATYLIGDERANEEDPLTNPTAIGDLSSILSWIDSQEKETLKPKFNSPESIMAVLHSTPAAIATLLGKVSTDDWRMRPNPDNWSLLEIICHLRDTDKEIYLPRTKKIIAEDLPLIEAVDADQWAEERRYNEEEPEKALSEFLESRIALLDVLKYLPEPSWNRPARHTIFGPTQLFELAQFMARHDRLHISQIAQLLSRL